MKPRVFGVALACLLAGCAVGPNFHRPAPPDETHYRPGGDDAPDSASPQRRAAAPVADDWWTAFDAPVLNDLVKRALVASPEVGSAEARLRAAQAQLRAGYGALFPAIGVSADATRQKYNPSRVGVAGAPVVYSLYTPSVAVSYALDLFGANRRTVESLRAQAEQQRQITRGVYLTLESSVVTTVIARAAFHDQVAALEQVLAADEDQARAAAARVEGGTAPYSTQLALEAQLESSRAALSQARVRAAQADNLLATLLGATPASANLPDLRLSDIHAPASVPLTAPSALARRRPDILAAEAALHAATAQVGVATAALLPDITLSASTGSSANSFDKLFTAGTGVWSYGAAVAQPVFQGGTLLNKRAATVALRETAFADYRQTVLQAFAQVADVLTAIDQDFTAARAQRKADEDAETAFKLVTANREAGLASDADLEFSLAQYQQAHVVRLAAESTALQDCVALFAALGGGWSR
jgi:NodT family efflux transporter outer membrane factor (OMF) lipoprotein